MADTAQLNVINSSRILSKIWKFPGISRIEVAESLSLDRSTVTKIINPLVDKGWVTVAKKEKKRGAVGRNPVGLCINNSLGVILGIEIQTQLIRGVVIDLSGNILFEKKAPFLPEQETLLDRIVTFTRNIDEELKKEKRALLMLGVGLSGIVDPYEGEIVFSNPLRIFSRYPLAEYLHEKLGLVVALENDANCCSWGELVYRKDNFHENFLTVLGEFRSTNIQGLRKVGIAIGLALVVNGKVYYGDNFTSGEFRSLDWVEGNVTQFSITNEEAEKVVHDDEILHRVLEELSRNLSLIVNVCSFSRIVLSGELLNYRDEFSQCLVSQVNRNWLYTHAEPKKIYVDIAPHSENAVAFGAASTALMRIFSVPRLTASTKDYLKGTELLSALLQAL